MKSFPEECDLVRAHQIRAQFEDALSFSRIKGLEDFFLALAKTAAEVFNAQLVTVWDSSSLSDILALQASWPERNPVQGSYAIARDRSFTGLAVTVNDHVFHSDLSTAIGELRFANPQVVEDLHLEEMVSIAVRDVFDSDRVILVVNLCHSTVGGSVNLLSLDEVNRLTRFWAQSLVNLTNVIDEAIREAVGRIVPSATGVASLFDLILPVLQSSTRSTFAGIFLWDETEKRLEAERSNRIEPIPEGLLERLVSTCVTETSPFLMREDGSFADEDEVRSRVMAVPIFSTSGEILGVLACYDPSDSKPISLSFSSSDLRVLLKVSALISPSVERFVRLRRGSGLDLAVKQIAASIASEYELLDVLQKTIDTIVRLTNSEVGSIYLMEGDGSLIMRAGAGSNKGLINKATYSVGEGLTGTVALGKVISFKTREEVLASSMYAGKYDEYIWPNDTSTGQRECENFLGVPIRLRGQVFGVMKIANKRASYDHPAPYFTDEDIQFAGVISSFLGYAIESSRLEEKKIKNFRLLAQSTINIESAKSVDDAVSTIMSSLEEGGFRNALLSLYNKETNRIEGTISAGRRWAGLERHVRYLLNSNDVLSQVLRQNRSEFIPDSRADRRCDQKLISAGNIVAQYIMPLRLGDELIGTLQVDLGLQKDAPEDMRLILQAFAGHLAVAISRIRSLDALVEMTNQVMSSSRFIVAETLSSMAVHSVHHQIRKIMSDLRRDLGRKDIREKEFLKETLGGWERDLGRLEIDLEKALSFVRADSEDLSDDLAEMHPQIQKAIDFWITSLSRAKCVVENQFFAKDSVCRLPPQACQEIISVLLVNSIQAHAKKITIETRNQSDVVLMEKVTLRHALCVDVSDNGLGLATAKPEEIFEPTYSTKPDKFGTGLGLFIARQLARRAGGDLSVSPSAHKARSVTFSLTLPVVLRRP